MRWPIDNDLRSTDGSVNSSKDSERSSRCKEGLMASAQAEDVETVTGDMRSPEEKLSQWESRAQALAENEQPDACVRALVLCVALTRLVYGDQHLQLAQAHAKLAQGYLQLKGWASQAREHSSRGRAVLSLYSPSSTDAGERTDVLKCSLLIFYTQGRSALLLGNLEESELCLKEADRIVEEVQQPQGVGREKSQVTQIDIATGLSRLYKQQGRPGEALGQCERALQLLGDSGDPRVACAIYRDMAAIELEEGWHDRAIQHLLKAHSMAQEAVCGGQEEAHIARSLALAYSVSEEPGHIDTVERFFKECLSGYSSSLGTQDPLTLSTQDEYCRILLATGQKECEESATTGAAFESLCDKPAQAGRGNHDETLSAVKIQRESLPLKRSTFGDLSPEVAETLQLIGGVEMTQGEMRRAYRTMTRCLEIHSLLYGHQHKKTRASQQTVDMLARAPEVAGRRQKTSSLKIRPPFCAVVSSKPVP